MVCSVRAWMNEYLVQISNQTVGGFNASRWNKRRNLTAQQTSMYRVIFATSVAHTTESRYGVSVTD